MTRFLKELEQAELDKMHIGEYFVYGTITPYGEVLYKIGIAVNWTKTRSMIPCTDELHFKSLERAMLRGEFLNSRMKGAPTKDEIRKEIHDNERNNGEHNE